MRTLPAFLQVGWWLETRTRLLTLILTIAVIISSSFSFSVLVRSEHPFTSGHSSYTLLGLNLLLVTTLAFVVLRKFVRTVKSRRAKLHARVVLLFTVIAVFPTLIVAIFSAAFFRVGIQSWFNEQVGMALEESVKVAESYLTEHKQIIRVDAILMANDLNREALALSQNPALFNRIIPIIAGIRKVPEAIVIQMGKNGRPHILGRTNFSYALEFALDDITPETLARADKGEVVILTDDQEDRVRALIKLESFFDGYLLIGRYVDSKILAHMENTRGSVNEYRRLKSNISSIQIQFLIIFSIIAFLLLLLAVWSGLVFAGRLMRPVGELARVTARLKTGDLSARVPEEAVPQDEIGTLAKAFNEMAGQLERQRNQLIDINQQIDARRRFSEAVLAGVSAGVLALTRSKDIELCNRSALQLLELPKEKLEGHSLASVLPELVPLVDAAAQQPDQEVRREVTVKQGARKLVLLARVIAERLSGDIEGYIVTFDDITELQVAQRSAAWSDVARRIAHEIKNPLTPIHLAAERLKRKYAKEVQSEPDMFVKYTDTITRHVSDIGRMVEEFVQFARMPAPSMARGDLVPLLQDAAFSQQTVSPFITIKIEAPQTPVMVRLDKGQITQVLTNLFKNAAESIEARLKINPEPAGEMIAKIVVESTQISLSVSDNGGGFPPDLMDRLTEPYVTTRAKGTGLGLAIVKKVMDDHNGKLVLSNILDKNGAVLGASVMLQFKPVNEA